MGKDVRRRKLKVDSTVTLPRTSTHASMTPNSSRSNNAVPHLQNLVQTVFRNLSIAWSQLWFPRKVSRFAKILAIVLVCLLIWPLKIHFFGRRGSLQGGLLGRFVDNFLRTLHFRDALQRRNRRLAEFGYHRLPPLTEPNVNQRGIPVLTQSYLAETLIRTSQRRKAQEAAFYRASLWNQSYHVGIPPWILQPNIGEWFHPWKDTGGMEILQFDESDMHRLVRNQFPGLLPFFDDATRPLQERIMLWSLCALYQYGGYFIASKINNFTSFQQSKKMPLELGTSLHVAGMALSRNNLNAFDSKVVFLAATPGHSQLKCALQRLSDQINATLPKKDKSLDVVSAVEVALGADIITHANIWYRRRRTTESAAGFLCSNLGEHQEVSVNDTPQKEQQPTILLKLVSEEHHDKVNKAVFQSARTSRVVVDVTEPSGTPHPKTESKQPIQRVLDDARCVAGWLCNRCLKTPWYGTFKICSVVCNSCYEKILCQRSEDTVKKDIVIDVTVREQRRLGPGEKLIPRIIHQTWFDEISPERYPHFVRFQNSWKSSGWEYRFYTDDDVRDYISRNFPARFLAAFDALIPGAFKADVFRLVVLLKEGGIYVDVDVKLDANLDSFITSTMSFFVPRDLVAEPHEYCLWNGIIGAAPGHPLIAAALERLLNTVLNRADYHDIERDMCQKSGTGRATEIWKARALPVVLLTGPCALGIAINSALGRDSLVSKIDTGWLQPNRTATGTTDMFGDMLVLLADKYDMGEMRFTDVDRNLLFASTNQNLMPSGALEIVNGSPITKAKPKAHYSTTVRKSGDVFGARAVYADDQVTNENVKLLLSYKMESSTEE